MAFAAVIGFSLLGLVVGSFLNVCIDRLPGRRSIVSPSSRCDACGHRLAPLDLVPVLSYLALRGRCRYCKAPIPRRAPLVELAAGLAFALLWYHYGATLELAAALSFTCFFIVIFVIDLEHHLILNRVVYPAILVAVAFALITHQHEALQSVWGGLAGTGLLLLIALLFPQGMGFGDVKFAAFIGLVVGFPQVFVSLSISFVMGGLVAIALLLSGWKRRGEYVPFGPFLTVGAATAMLYGQEILRWYVGTIH